MEGAVPNRFAFREPWERMGHVDYLIHRFGTLGLERHSCPESSFALSGGLRATGTPVGLRPSIPGACEFMSVEPSVPNMVTAREAWRFSRVRGKCSIQPIVR